MALLVVVSPPTGVQPLADGALGFGPSPERKVDPGPHTLYSQVAPGFAFLEFSRTVPLILSLTFTE